MPCSDVCASAQPKDAVEPLLHDAQPRMDRPAKRLRSVVIPPVQSEKLAGKEEAENAKPPLMSGVAPAAENSKQPPMSERASAVGKARSAWREEWERRRAAELAAADVAGMPTAATGGGPLARANSNCSDPRFVPHIEHFHTRSALWRHPVVHQKVATLFGRSWHCTSHGIVTSAAKGKRQNCKCSAQGQDATHTQSRRRSEGSCSEPGPRGAAQLGARSPCRQGTQAAPAPACDRGADQPCARRGARRGQGPRVKIRFRVRAGHGSRA